MVLFCVNENTVNSERLFCLLRGLKRCSHQEDNFNDNDVSVHIEKQAPFVNSGAKDALCTPAVPSGEENGY